LAGEKSDRSGHVDMQQKSGEHDKQKNVPSGEPETLLRRTSKTSGNCSIRDSNSL
jgi:hypothetical protein